MTTFSPMELDELQSKILSGEINIQQPIQLTNSQGNEMKLISFVDYLYLYPQTNKEKYLSILLDTFQLIHTELKTKVSEFPINKVYNGFLSVMGKSDIVLSDIENPFSEEEDTQSMIREFMSSYQSINSALNQPVVSPLETMIVGNSLMTRHMDSFLIIHENTTKQIKKYHTTLHNQMKQLSKIPIDVFIRLSMINHFDYGNEKQKIPKNIHQFFLNYIYVSILFKEELYHKINNLVKLTNEMNQKKLEITDMKQNMEVISKSGMEQAYRQQELL